MDTWSKTHLFNDSNLGVLRNLAGTILMSYNGFENSSHGKRMFGYTNKEKDIRWSIANPFYLRFPIACFH